MADIVDANVKVKVTSALSGFIDTGKAVKDLQDQMLWNNNNIIKLISLYGATTQPVPATLGQTLVPIPQSGYQRINSALSGFGAANARVGASLKTASKNIQTISAAFAQAQANMSKANIYNKQKDELISQTKVKFVKKFWFYHDWYVTVKNFFKPIVRITPRYKIMGCCVCKTVTPANMPWYRPWIIMDVQGMLKKDFPYKDHFGSTRVSEGNTPIIDSVEYQFIVCSEGCENFVYLSLLDL